MRESMWPSFPEKREITSIHKTISLWQFYLLPKPCNRNYKHFILLFHPFTMFSHFSLIQMSEYLWLRWDHLWSLPWSSLSLTTTVSSLWLVTDFLSYQFSLFMFLSDHFWILLNSLTCIHSLKHLCVNIERFTMHCVLCDLRVNVSNYD